MQRPKQSKCLLAKELWHNNDIIMLHRCSIAFRRRHLGQTSKSRSLHDNCLDSTVIFSPRYCDDSHRWPRWPRYNLLTTGWTTFVLLTMRKLAVVTEVAAAKAEISAWSLLQYEIQVSCFEQEIEYLSILKRLLQENEHNIPRSTISHWTVQE